MAISSGIIPATFRSLRVPSREATSSRLSKTRLATSLTQIVREFDLTGMTVLETNAARVNEQLAAMGMRSISAFHHEARRLPDGKILVLAAVEQILTDVQGPGPVDVLGDMIIVMDSNLQVVVGLGRFRPPGRDAACNLERSVCSGGLPLALPGHYGQRLAAW